MKLTTTQPKQLEDFTKELTSSNGKPTILFSRTELNQSTSFKSGDGAKLSKLTRLAIFLTHGAERQETRKQIKQLLASNHIAITPDMKKLMPSRFNFGNAQALGKLLPNAEFENPTLAKIKPHLKHEVHNLVQNFKISSKLESATQFLRSNGLTARGLTILEPAFQVVAVNLAANAHTAFDDSLKRGESLDDALLSARNNIKKGLADVELDKDFMEIAAFINDSLKEEMSAAGLDKNNDATTKSFIGIASKSIISGMLLRTFSPALTTALVDQEDSFKKSIRTHCSIAGKSTDPSTYSKKVEITELQEEKASARTLASMVQAEINISNNLQEVSSDTSSKLKHHKYGPHNSLTQAFPKLINDLQTSDGLVNFNALTKINQN